MEPVKCNFIIALNVMGHCHGLINFINKFSVPKGLVTLGLVSICSQRTSYLIDLSERKNS